MYKGFIVDDFDENSDFQNKFFEVWESSSSQENKFLANKDFNIFLKDFIIRDSVNRDLILDGAKLAEHYFPSVQADIFISHSHKDVKKAKAFAKYIYIKTGLVSFIDSEVWSFAEDLLRCLDNEYCYNSGSMLYSYEKRNISTSYVHMMLNTALLNMIDKCECLFFLSTPNSFNTEKEIKNTTFSPWIYSELSMANVIRKKKPRRYQRKKLLIEQSVTQFSQEDLKIAFPLKTENLIKCKASQIQYWLSGCKSTKKIENLDKLYEMLDSPRE